jgi:Transposase zinc-ribbon domain
MPEMSDANRRQKQAAPTSVTPLPDFPANLLEFHRMFPDEAACRRYLERMRWPSGFICERCEASEEPLRLATRAGVLKCRSCLHQTRLTAGTIMQGTRTPLQVWFWATYLIATQTSGISALELQKQLGVARYETAFVMLHKLRAAIRTPLGHSGLSRWTLPSSVASTREGGAGRRTKRR